MNGHSNEVKNGDNIGIHKKRKIHDNNGIHSKKHTDDQLELRLIVYYICNGVGIVSLFTVSILYALYISQMHENHMWFSNIQVIITFV